MSENSFTKQNQNVGLRSQVILDAGLNVFALKLLIESFTQVAGKDTTPVEFTYMGVKVRLQVDDKAVEGK